MCPYFLLIICSLNGRLSKLFSKSCVWEHGGQHMSVKQNVHSTVSLRLSEWFSWTKQAQLPDQPPAEPDGCHHIRSGVRISICPWRWETGHYLQKLVKSRTIPNMPWWKVQLWCHTLPSRASLPLKLSSGVCVFLSFFKKTNSSISLHPPSSHPPQVVCSALSSPVWITDWCPRLQVKVTEVHYWIIFALLSLLPSAWPLLVDVVGALQGALSANALKTWMCVHVVCVIPLFYFILWNKTNIMWTQAHTLHSYN